MLYSQTSVHFPLLTYIELSLESVFNQVCFLSCEICHSSGLYVSIIRWVRVLQPSGVAVHVPHRCCTVNSEWCFTNCKATRQCRMLRSANMILVYRKPKSRQTSVKISQSLSKDVGEILSRLGCWGWDCWRRLKLGFTHTHTHTHTREHPPTLTTNTHTPPTPVDASASEREDLRWGGTAYCPICIPPNGVSSQSRYSLLLPLVTQNAFSFLWPAPIKKTGVYIAIYTELLWITFSYCYSLFCVFQCLGQEQKICDCCTSP